MNVRRLHYPYDPAIEHKTFLYCAEYSTILFVFHLRHEARIVYVGIELLAFDARVEPLETVFLERLQ